MSDVELERERPRPAAFKVLRTGKVSSPSDIKKRAPAHPAYFFVFLLLLRASDDDDFFHRRVLGRLVVVRPSFVGTEKASSASTSVLRLETFFAEKERGVVETPECFGRARCCPFFVIVFAQRGCSGELVTNVQRQCRVGDEADRYGRHDV